MKHQKIFGIQPSYKKSENFHILDNLRNEKSKKNWYPEYKKLNNIGNQPKYEK